MLAIQSLGLGEAGNEAVKAAFRQIDTNQNGKLDMSEAMAAFELIKNIFSQSKNSQ